jgi:hypothetical protein
VSTMEKKMGRDPLAGRAGRVRLWSARRRFAAEIDRGPSVLACGVPTRPALANAPVLSLRREVSVVDKTRRERCSNLDRTAIQSVFSSRLTHPESSDDGLQ